MKTVLAAVLMMAFAASAVYGLHHMECVELRKVPESTRRPFLGLVSPVGLDVFAPALEVDGTWMTEERGEGERQREG